MLRIKIGAFKKKKVHIPDQADSMFHWIIRLPTLPIPFVLFVAMSSDATYKLAIPTPHGIQR